MEEIKLEVEIRKEVGTRKIKSLRNNGFIPAVVYGLDKEPTTVKVNQREYEKIMRAHKGQSLVFHLNVMDDGKKLRDYSAIVKEEQRHPVKEVLTHIDFNRIDLSQEIEVTVPVVAKGEAEGMKTDGGSLDHGIWELDIICLPKNIPEKIEVDISSLKIGDSILVKDIAFPEGVSTHHDPEGIVFHIVPPMKDADAMAADGEAATGAEPQVIKKAKEEESA